LGILEHIDTKIPKITFPSGVYFNTYIALSKEGCPLLSTIVPGICKSYNYLIAFIYASMSSTINALGFHSRRSC
jgi:hypothetical protein